MVVRQTRYVISKSRLPSRKRVSDALRLPKPAPWRRLQIDQGVVKNGFWNQFDHINTTDAFDLVLRTLELRKLISGLQADFNANAFPRVPDLDGQLQEYESRMTLLGHLHTSPDNRDTEGTRSNVPLVNQALFEGANMLGMRKAALKIPFWPWSSRDRLETGSLLLTDQYFALDQQGEEKLPSPLLTRTYNLLREALFYYIFAGHPGLASCQGIFSELHFFNNSVTMPGIAFDYLERTGAQSNELVSEKGKGALLLYQYSEALKTILDLSKRAHEWGGFKGVLHLDIHAGNIIITKDGSVKLIDWGAWRFIETDGFSLPQSALVPQFNPHDLSGGEAYDAVRFDEKKTVRAIASYLISKSTYADTQLEGFNKASWSNPDYRNDLYNKYYLPKVRFLEGRYSSEFIKVLGRVFSPDLDECPTREEFYRAMRDELQRGGYLELIDGVPKIKSLLTEGDTPQDASAVGTLSGAFNNDVPGHLRVVSTNPRLPEPLGAK